MHYACRFGHVSLVQALLLYGADLCVRDSENKTPVDDAQSSGHFGLIVEMQKRLPSLTLPLPLEPPELEMADKRQLTVRWQPPQPAMGRSSLAEPSSSSPHQATVAYRLQIARVSDRKWRDVSDRLTANRLHIKSLSPDEAYITRVARANAFGWGPFSEVSDVMRTLPPILEEVGQEEGQRRLQQQHRGDSGGRDVPSNATDTTEAPLTSAGGTNRSEAQLSAAAAAEARLRQVAATSVPASATNGRRVPPVMPRLPVGSAVTDTQVDPSRGGSGSGAGASGGRQGGLFWGNVSKEKNQLSARGASGTTTTASSSSSAARRPQAGGRRNGEGRVDDDNNDPLLASSELPQRPRSAPPTPDECPLDLAWDDDDGTLPHHPPQHRHQRQQQVAEEIDEEDEERAPRLPSRSPQGGSRGSVDLPLSSFEEAAQLDAALRRSWQDHVASRSPSHGASRASDGRRMPMMRESTGGGGRGGNNGVLPPVHETAGSRFPPLFPASSPRKDTAGGNARMSGFRRGPIAPTTDADNNDDNANDDDETAASHDLTWWELERRDLKNAVHDERVARKEAERRCRVAEKRAREADQQLSEAGMRERQLQGQPTAIEHLSVAALTELEKQLETSLRVVRETRDSKITAELGEAKDRSFCVICLTRPKSVLLLPCKHLCICDECLKYLSEESKREMKRALARAGSDPEARRAAGKERRFKCPVCRSPVQKTIDVYS